ncbi:MAG: tail fiber protein [Phototrophicales bacterium]
MSEPFIAEIRMFAGNFAPRGWAFCDGQLLAVSQNDALFSLLGTIYGGDGRTTFGLPDLRGRIPIHAGQGTGLSPRRLGQKGGEETVTLTVNQLPPHNHTIHAANSGNAQSSPVGNLPGTDRVVMYFNSADRPATLAANTIESTGNSQPHSNLMPFLCINFIISLFGIYPQRV